MWPVVRVSGGQAAGAGAEGSVGIGRLKCNLWFLIKVASLG